MNIFIWEYTQKNIDVSVHLSENVCVYTCVDIGVGINVKVCVCYVCLFGYVHIWKCMYMYESSCSWVGPPSDF